MLCMIEEDLAGQQIFNQLNPRYFELVGNTKKVKMVKCLRCGRLFKGSSGIRRCGNCAKIR